ncbi:MULTISPECIES: mannose-binding protein [unclassified Streptomyces]|uniref:mannose-binding protein n=1 Tax=unclassified Streptomyces TaxID=2593676 RepID=UPI0007466C8E|nr:MULTISPECIES: mannose-binding protein [unclassified Streptomyces]KUL71265.1 mannose-binding protein [Streptomyces sp. NRRL WC-3604]KUL77114.1 mannose-binding protein [Streptomyces sp. NRRL WC-3605]
MSPQHPTPDANAEAAATRAGGTGSPSTPSAPEQPAPSQGSAMEPEPGNTGQESGTEGAKSPTGTGPDERQARGAGGEAGAETAQSQSAAGGTAKTKSTTSGTAETASTTAPASPSATSTSTASPETRAAVAAAAAVGTMPPNARTSTGVGSGRPRKPILAGAAVAGAALIAIPLLLTGSAKDDGPPDSAKGLAAGGSDTVLNPTSAPAALDDYVAEKPSPSPKKTKATKSAPAKLAPPPAAPTTKSSPSGEQDSKPKAKPKPKATPKPNWSTETVHAPSVLEVNQAWTTNRIRMVMQTDGNLVVYNEQRKPIWASMTFGANHRAIFQPDGNLVIHNGEDRPIWASQTWGHEGAQLVLRADAKVVIVQHGGVLWST